MTEEKRNRGAAEERPPKPGGPKATAGKQPTTQRARDAAAAGAKEKRSSRPKPAAKRPERKPRKPLPKRDREGPGAARLFALLAGALLSILGVVGFFYDASFGTGADLASDDLAGTLMVNGWRNVLYVVTGITALSFAPRRPRATALAVGLLYLTFAIWGFIVTDRGIGSILDFLPLGNDDNALHLAIGVLGLLAALVDGPLPKVPESVRKRLRKLKPKLGKPKLKLKKPELKKRKPKAAPKKGAGKRPPSSGKRPTSSSSSSSSSSSA